MRTALTFPLLRNGSLPLPIGERKKRGGSSLSPMGRGQGEGRLHERGGRPSPSHCFAMGPFLSPSGRGKRGGRVNVLGARHRNFLGQGRAHRRQAEDRR